MCGKNDGGESERCYRKKRFDEIIGIRRKYSDPFRVSRNERAKMSDVRAELFVSILRSVIADRNIAGKFGNGSFEHFVQSICLDDLFKGRVIGILSENFSCLCNHISLPHTSSFNFSSFSFMIAETPSIAERDGRFPSIEQTSTGSPIAITTLL